MLNFPTARMLTLPTACMIAFALCMTVGCKREPEEVAPATAVSSPAPAPEGSANSAATQATTPKVEADSKKTLAERWIDVDLPLDEGPSLNPPSVAYLRLRLGDDGRWNLAMSKSPRFNTIDAESTLGTFEAIAHGSKSAGPWDKGNAKKFEEIFVQVRNFVRAAVTAQDDVESVQLAMSDKLNESSSLHIDKTAPMALVALVVDAVHTVRNERKSTGTRTPLAITFRNSSPEVMGRATSPDENAKRVDPTDATTPPEQSVTHPISKSGIIRDKSAKDTCAVYIYNHSPDAPTADGWRIRIGTANAKPVTEVAALRDELKAAIAAIGSNTIDENGLSNLRLLIHADHRAPSHFFNVIMAACMHSDVKIYQMSLASLSPVDSQGK